MENQKKVTLKNKLSESERLSKIIEDFAEGKNFSLKFLFEIDVALDEIITNIVSYAYNDKAEHKILVRLFSLKDGLKIQVEDEGISFNPLERAEPDITKSVMERPIGGLGIHMVRKLVDELKYKRENNKNILTLIKKIDKKKRRKQMKINQEKKGDVLILGLNGRLDSNTTGELEKTVVPLIEGGDHKIIIDFSELDYISSAGLRTLLLAAKKLKSVGGKIILCSMKEFIKEIFEMAGFTSIFKIVADLGEAEKEVG